MKKLILLFSVLMPYLAMAQDAADGKEADNFVYVTVSQSLNIKDWIVVQNSTGMNIEKFAVSTVDADGELHPLCIASDIVDGEIRKVSYFSGNKLKYLRGQTIAVKAKGVNIDGTLSTYDFDVYCYEQNHDLYINLTSRHILDF